MNRKLLFLILFFSASMFVAKAEGKQKQGVYAARYEIPFRSMFLGENMKSNGEKSLQPEYYGGRLVIEVLTHNPEKYAIIQFEDSNGERIWHDYLCEDPKPRVLHVTESESITTINNEYVTCIERYVVDFNPVRFQFALYRNKDGQLKCQVLRLILQDGKEVFTGNSYAAFFPASAMDSFREFFREAQQYRAIRML